MELCQTFNILLDLISIVQNGHVFLIDDDDDLRASVQDLLQFAGYRTHSWPDAASFLSSIPNVAPAVVITDMRMPGLCGTELHASLKAMGRTLPVIYLSGQSSLQQGIEAMKLGAHEFLIKPVPREALLKAVASGLEKDRYQMRHMLQRSRMEQAIQHLSPRERGVHQLMLKGYSNAEIMDQLGISLPTAKQYKSEVMRKLGVRSLSQLIELSQSSAD